MQNPLADHSVTLLGEAEAWVHACDEAPRLPPLPHAPGLTLPPMTCIAATPAVVPKEPCVEEVLGAERAVRSHTQNTTLTAPPDAPTTLCVHANTA